MSKGSTPSANQLVPTRHSPTTTSHAGYNCIAPSTAATSSHGVSKTSSPAIELRPTGTGNGYFALADNGEVIAFGDALGRGRAKVGGSPIDIAVRP